LRQHKVQKHLLLRTKSRADRNPSPSPFVPPASKSARLTNQATAVPKWFVIPASASPRRLAVGSLFSLGSSVFLCALSLLSWFYYHPVVVATRPEKRSIQ
jgi:hypothetical protein